MIKLEDASMIAVARGRVDSVRWNFLIGVWFAVGAALTLNSTAAGLSWCLVLTLALAFDHVLGRSYLSAHGKERATAGGLFFWSCLFSISLVPAMAILLAVNGGGPGRVLGALMAASSLLSVTLSMFQSPRFMLLMALPATLALLALPAINVGEAPARGLDAALGVGCGVAGFLACVARAAIDRIEMAQAWKAANLAAEQPQLHPKEAGRALEVPELIEEGADAAPDPEALAQQQRAAA